LGKFPVGTVVQNVDCNWGSQVWVPGQQTKVLVRGKNRRLSPRISQTEQKTEPAHHVRLEHRGTLFETQPKSAAKSQTLGGESANPSLPEEYRRRTGVLTRQFIALRGNIKETLTMLKTNTIGVKLPGEGE